MPRTAPDINYQLPEPLKELLNDASPWPTPSQNQKVVAKGSIVAFSYVGQGRTKIHDPFPLVIVSDIYADEVRGVNLHYLTIPYVKGVVQTFGNNVRFSYANIKADSYIVSAFRSYKRGGITQLRMLDTAFLQKLMKVVRALAPGEIEQMRSQIQNAIRQGPKQPKAQAGLEPQAKIADQFGEGPPQDLGHLTE